MPTKLNYEMIFEDVRHAEGPYIQVYRVNKAYEIQEWDDLDPNVTGGSQFIIAFYVTPKGLAPNDGFGLHNLTPLKIGVVDNRMVFQDNEKDIADFNFYKVFSAEETLMVLGNPHPTNCKR